MTTSGEIRLRMCQPRLTGAVLIPPGTRRDPQTNRRCRRRLLAHMLPLGRDLCVYSSQVGGIGIGSPSVSVRVSQAKKLGGADVAPLSANEEHEAMADHRGRRRSRLRLSTARTYESVHRTPTTLKPEVAKVAAARHRSR